MIRRGSVVLELRLGVDRLLIYMDYFKDIQNFKIWRLVSAEIMNIFSLLGEYTMYQIVTKSKLYKFQTKIENQVYHVSPPFRDDDNGWESRCGELTRCFLPRALLSLSLVITGM